MLVYQRVNSGNQLVGKGKMPHWVRSFCQLTFIYIVGDFPASHVWLPDGINQYYSNMISNQITNEILMKSHQITNEILMKSHQITMKSSWNPHEIASNPVKSPWNRHDIPSHEAAVIPSPSSSGVPPRWSQAFDEKTPWRYHKLEVPTIYKAYIRPM